QLSPTSVSFGSIEVGTTSSALQVTVQNSGASAVAINSLSVAAPFALASNACGSSIAASTACQLTVEFAPTQTGAAAGALTLTTTDGTQSVALTGVGAAPPTDTLSPSSLVFGGTIVGQTSAAQAVQLSNSGGEPLTSIAVAVSGPYQVASNCGTQLAAGSNCSLSVTFTPTAAGTQNGTITVSDILKSQTVALTGTGLLPPAFSVSPSSLSFPAQLTGVASAPLTLTVSNVGGAPLANVGFQITGQSALSFAVGSTNCGATLANGSSCSAQIVFTPALAGGSTATLTVTSSTLGVKAATVALGGSGQAAAGLNVNPAQLTFIEATLGQASPAQTVTVSNTGQAAVSNLILTTAAPFSVTQTSCGTSLAAGASCTASLVFTPTANGQATGTLTVSSSNDLPASVLLTGLGGQAGSVQVTPGLLSFPVTGVGGTSAAQTITVANTSAVALPSLTLSVSGPFQLGSDTCTGALSPGASCTAVVAFAPTQTGHQTGNLTVSSTAMASAAQIPLSGAGFDFTATVIGQSSFTVASGQTASFTLALTPQGGVPITFTFQCGSVPANVACTFNPATDSVAANTTSQATVQIATGQAASVARTGPSRGWGGWPAAWGLAVLPLTWKRRRKLLLAMAGLLLAGGVCSCSGAGGGTNSTPPVAPPGTTPAGTYQVVVKVTAAGVSHNATVTLTVD
ncbi:MAG: choice-of-anchor D domain-containing protein, partial [Acidobacteriota bacterium]|nr:choice-of-anchor D domain-containing protein [Acidobacteriota bacterium]